MPRARVRLLSISSTLQCYPTEYIYIDRDSLFLSGNAATTPSSAHDESLSNSIEVAVEPDTNLPTAFIYKSLPPSAYRASSNGGNNETPDSSDGPTGDKTGGSYRPGDNPHENSAPGDSSGPSGTHNELIIYTPSTAPSKSSAYHLAFPAGATVFPSPPVVSPMNYNIPESEKELLRWHYRLGHMSFKRIQFVMRSGVLATSPTLRHLHSVCSKIIKPPMCAACQYAKAKQRPTPGVKTTIVQD